MEQVSNYEKLKLHSSGKVYISGEQVWQPVWSLVAQKKAEKVDFSFLQQSGKDDKVHAA